MSWDSSAELAERHVSRPVGATWPDTPTPDEVVAEFVRCMGDPFYFINNYCSVKEEVELLSEASEADPTAQKGGRWLRFEMWESQRPALDAIHHNAKTVILKARQLGMTWLSLAYVLWMVLFKDGITALLFSKGDRESLEMLVRFKGMFTRLPPWMVPSGTWTKPSRTGNVRLYGEAGHTLRLANGSRVISLPANTGDSFTAAVAVVDEADLVEKLAPHLGALKPTVDNGGKLILLSRSNKSKPNSPFKGIYRAAVEGAVDYAPVFLPWYAHPGRTDAWYESQRRDSLATTFSLDQLWEQYPATASEALADNQLDKRFPEEFIGPLFVPAPDLCLSPDGWPTIRAWDWEPDHPYVGTPCPPPTPEEVAAAAAAGHPDRLPEKVFKAVPAPRFNGLRVYKMPVPGGRYAIGADPAQGMVTSNDSAAVVVECSTGEEVASFNTKTAPKTFASHVAQVADWFSALPEAVCSTMVEQNNHGHAFILWWQSNRNEENTRAGLLRGPSGNIGWTQTGKSKETMYHRAAQRVSDGRCVFHTRQLKSQVGSIEAETLCAPEGSLDDLAVAWGLALAAADLYPKRPWAIRGGEKAAPEADKPEGES